MFELTDAVLCADGPVTSLVELTLVAELRRGHGAMYDALNQGFAVDPNATTTARWSWLGRKSLRTGSPQRQVRALSSRSTGRLT